MLSPIPALVIQNIFQDAIFVCYYFMHYERTILVSKREHSARFLSGGSSHQWWWGGSAISFPSLKGLETCVYAGQEKRQRAAEK